VAQKVRESTRNRMLALSAQAKWNELRQRFEQQLTVAPSLRQ